ncbi:hypothetical protein CLAFUW4_14378 [Fulvia fulva]|uniref:Uncharacterized protein n=1 Tax=Passalora fulva TaxID=5499 RepID=A0A9Q8PMG8_PASFU|nr:uncharacterized protein CLAFUR5_14209 [Fulvia fulva]KAK4609957.1 hypothetical protein CLAFUR0_14379 [Fulvia fulva]UJO25334.1 hypothetical protein CLAFUR5_14209 [Fulvia fulva]WPV22551.1 hypothetical protein CLAFUW4_14378 [Fulvia fulva]
MGKRRRERDRPKAGPEAAYDPNKRVLLSYASDDEQVEDASEQKQNGSNDTPAIDAHVSNYQFDEYPHEDDEVKLGATEDTADPEEPAQSIAQGEDVEEAAGPSNKDEESEGRVRQDHVTGQFTALGPDPDEEYDSTTEEAMAYLRGVRTERQKLPEVLTANGQVPHDTNGDATADDLEGDYDEDEGYFLEDGGYVGAPTSDTAVEDDRTDPQKAFTAALRQRFLTQRKQLHLPTTADALAALGDGRPISFPKGNTKAYAEWHRLLSSQQPNLPQLRSLAQETVFDLLALLQKHLMRKDKNIDSSASAWIWSLLARLDDVGSMSNDQVYPLREFGKRALFLQLSFLKPEIAAQLEAVGQTGVSTGDEHEELQEAELDEADRSSASTPAISRDLVTDNTLATLDTILVVIGEVFGQRDLLDFRQPWAVAAAPT